MAATIDVDVLDDEHEQRGDFRRANGSPMVSDPDRPGKSLRYRRPSSFAKALDDESALTEWRIWKAMQGVANSTALQTEVCAAKEEDRTEKKRLRERALDKGTANERADMGTGLHAMSARAEDPEDVDFDPPSQFIPDLNAYTDTLAAFGLVSEFVEIQVVNDDFRAAGTADRIYRLTKRLVTPDGMVLEPGELVLGDLKTGEKLDFGLPGYCVQMAIYATGKFYDVHADKRLPTPKINPHWTLLVHLPFGEAKCKLLWCPIKVGLHGAWLTQMVYEWRNKWKSGDKEYDAPEAVSPGDERIVEALEHVEDRVALIGDWCALRIKAIGAKAPAKEALKKRWPRTLPTPRQGPDKIQLIQILDLLDRVEAEFAIPFMKPPVEFPIVRSGDDHGDMSNARYFR